MIPLYLLYLFLHKLLSNFRDITCFYYVSSSTNRRQIIMILIVFIYLFLHKSLPNIDHFLLCRHCAGSPPSPTAKRGRRSPVPEIPGVRPTGGTRRRPCRRSEKGLCWRTIRADSVHHHQKVRKMLPGF